MEWFSSSVDLIEKREGMETERGGERYGKGERERCRRREEGEAKGEGAVGRGNGDGGEVGHTFPSHYHIRYACMYNSSNSFN